LLNHAGFVIDNDWSLEVPNFRLLSVALGNKIPPLRCIGSFGLFSTLPQIDASTDVILCVKNVMFANQTLHTNVFWG